MNAPTSRPRHPRRTTLADLASTVGGLSTQGGDGADDTVVTGVSLSSQRVRPGDLYAALPGARVHGVDYAAGAVEAGAVAVLTDPAGADRAPAGVPLVVADDPRSLLGRLAARVYGDPATRMRMVGVTGTQGKTTTTRLAESGLTAAGVPSAVIGTVGTRVRGTDVETTLTTPEAPDLHGLFAAMVEQEVDTCLMEVSSHALVMGRVDGIVFDVAVFLNLGRDHLDFHADVEDYYRAKASLFTPERARLALVNLDDERGRRLATETTLPVRTFSADGAEGADWRAVDVELHPQGSRFRVLGPGGVDVPAACPIPGGFNVANTLAAVAACAEAGLDAATVADGIATGAGVPGRLERVEAGQDFVVVVDYAHKPDAVEAAVAALRPVTAGKVVVVLGAGGDRDPGKRPIMGEIASRLADVLVVTDDNPRTEDPAAIRAAVLAGATGGAEVLEVGDRRAAIREALGRARAGDVVLVAGKGHETGQEVAGVVHPFDDRQVVREELEAVRS
ncbi:UDP-N-acetylmuramoyl-L-alanyl-D-glutamate--2,6-diaminopimelate ligase [Nocardioides deserti]|uniref:UDP-N-acetylmuramoyl-L-alanyl-D-glutamate--2,6-diaminopimelate ligase n=1 Tax=Nocardioides deserti TaxID=1588644 RepID=A0ABR6U4K9_9ACTN|nr:UDP-N-acetylmuramoyl-L-alanyl-D-glutamate--2,6-diaminopimelate ligase [Nocardioides deserti]MBC2958781.1 UDP-N-acetylmuramoyl-L-alanyl-D-glutamate--2,6-diaminopimelate ligase [Nocardioides deserti]GGO69675.1 UDP-N-acetylmuramoyl-L-alanyl-D-glutamate--2,6-diaminopimelate ligase [Nocardioides deserti]